MKKTNQIAALCFCILWNTCLFAQVSVNSYNIRVMTFNIMHGATLNNDFDLDRIAKIIKDAKPHLVALQEIDNKTQRVNGMDLAAEMGARTHLFSVFGKAMRYDGGEYGVAILSAFPVIDVQNVNLPFSRGKEPRTALAVLVKLPGGDTIRFISTHLDHTRLMSDRMAQVKKIDAVLGKDLMPSILAGDLNAQPESESIQLLRKNWQMSLEPGTPTHSSKKPTKQIDYIMYRPANRWKKLSAKVIADSVASDHRPIFVELKFLPTE